MTMGHEDNRTREELLEEIEPLRARLEEAEQTLDAIRSGEVDALIVTGPHGDQVFSLTGAERTYRLIVETMNEAALTVGLDGTVLFCNQRFCDLVNTPMADTIGQKVSAFAAPAQQEPLQKLLADAQISPVQRRLTLRAAEGAVVSVQISANLLVDDIHTSICLVASDLTELEAQAHSIQLLREQQQALEESKAELQVVNTELDDSRRNAVSLLEDALTARRQADQAAAGLRESEERFRTLADNIPQLCWMANADGWIFWYNQRWYEYTGTSPEQMEGWGWQSVHDPEVLPSVVERWQASIATGKPFDMVFPLRGCDGMFRPFLTRVMPVCDQSGEVVRWFGTNTEISEQRKIEEELRESEEKLSLALRSAEMGVWRLDLREQKRHFDDQVCRCLGIDPAHFGGTAEEFYAAVHPDDRDGLTAALDRTIESGAPYGAEYRVVWPDGGIRHVVSRGRLARDADGQPQWVDGLLWDITERKQAEERLQASLREKEVLLKEVHHRVKNNLQVITSLVNMQADATTDGTVREVLRDVTFRVRSMALVHEKLYHSESLAWIDFAEYAKSLLRYLWHAHWDPAATIGLTLDLEPVSLPVDTAVPCGLILNELAGNALKHAFRGRSEGDVTVSLHGGADGRISLSVRDNGIGLPPGLNWQQSGSLGLRLVQMLAGQLKGSVEVSSDAGTKFTVAFRLKAEG